MDPQILSKNQHISTNADFDVDHSATRLNGICEASSKLELLSGFMCSFPMVISLLAFEVWWNYS